MKAYVLIAWQVKSCQWNIVFVSSSKMRIELLCKQLNLLEVGAFAVVEAESLDENVVAETVLAVEPPCRACLARMLYVTFGTVVFDAAEQVDPEHVH